MEFAKTLLLDPATPYFAAGQKGSQPIPILNRFNEGLDQIAKDLFPVYLEPSATTRQKIAKSYGATGEGLGPLGLTRPPDPKAAMFPAGCIPNRDPVTNAPAPTDYPVRANACMWNKRSQIDQYVMACQELVEKMTATSS